MLLGPLYVDELTSITTRVNSGALYVFDVKSCPTIVLAGGLIRLFQSVELVKVGILFCKSNYTKRSQGFRIN